MGSYFRTTIDERQLRDFDRRLSQVGKVFDKAVTGRVLRVAVRPTLNAVRSNAPIGPAVSYKSSVRTRGRNRGKTRPAYELNRGGATRKDARIRVIEGRGNETVGALVGISQKGNRAGYRTHLITRINRHRRVANDFLAKSERETESQVLNGFAQAAEEVVAKTLLRG